jgi:hypothetical protein
MAREPARRRCFMRPPKAMASQPWIQEEAAWRGREMARRATQPQNQPSSQRPVKAARPRRAKPRRPAMSAAV